MRKILVLRGGALGDFIVTLPALALLRKRWPASRIELVGNATAARLVLPSPIPPATRPAKECHPLDDNLIFTHEDNFGICHLLDDKPLRSFDRWGEMAWSEMEGMTKKPGEWLVDRVYSQDEARWAALFGRAPLPSELVGWLDEFDLVLNFWPDPDRELSGKFPRRTGQVFLSAEALPSSAPAAKHYCAPLRELGLETTDYFHRLKLEPSRAKEEQPAPIAVHAGSGSAIKNWPVNRWAGLCEWLKAEHHAELLIVAGEADSTAADQLSRFGRLARNLPLRELATKLAGCRLFLGHDSGVSHLAAACGVPCLLLFGPTDPAVWAPPARHVQVIKGATTLDSIALEDIQLAISKLLSDPR